jgi:superfamily II DNA or RNA helicase
MNKQDRQLLSLLEINPNQLEKYFGKKTISRGIGYYKQGKVEKIKTISPAEDGHDKITIIGYVAGRYDKPYETKLTLSPDASFTGVEIQSYCSCPVGSYCKHGIALLFFFLDSGTQANEASISIGEEDADTSDGEVDEWLSAIQADEAEINSRGTALLTPPKPDQNFHLIYLLEYRNKKYRGSEEGLTVKYLRSRALKKGGYGQIYAIESYHILNPYHRYDHCYSNELDTEIVTALESFDAKGYALNKHYYLNSDIGEMILEKILKTGRCLWETQQSEPLTQGSAREIQLYWQQENNFYHPKFKVLPPINLLFSLQDLYYYLDQEQNQLGQARHPSLDFDKINYFLAAPRIEVAKAKQISEKIAQTLPDFDFPLPVALNLQQIEIDTPPVIHLKLHAIPRPIELLKENTLSILHLVSLSFQYNEINYQPKIATDLTTSHTTRIEDNTRYRVIRHLGAEQHALEQLQNTKFETLNIPPLGVGDFTAMAWTLEESVEIWDDFQSNIVPELEAAGWKIEIDDSFMLAVETVDDWYADLEETEGGDWFEMHLGFELNGKPINLLPMLVGLLANYADKEALHQSLESKEYQLLPLDNAQWIKIPTKRILLIIDTIIELYDTDTLNKEGNLSLPKYAGLHFNDLLNDPSLRWKGADELKKLNKKLRNFSGIESVELPTGLNATLRDYQKQGLDWLQFLRSYQFNGVLADDMGLGKTVQTLANLQIEKESGRADLPSIVIAPTSLMSNWKNEAARFTPDLSVLILQGPERKQYFAEITSYDLILTTYPLMIRDKALYKEHEFHYLILDEAQAIKNAKAKTTQLIYGLKARHRLCVTGTPMENHLGEIWSMYHFLMAGYLGTQQKFNRLFRNPIEKHADDTRGQVLRARIEPFLLRRTKDVVADELPEKTEMIRTVTLNGKQRDLYETVRVAMDKKVRDEIKKKGLARSHIMILDALLKLRQVCCDPQLVKLSKARNVKESAKLELLLTMVPEMVEEGRKILIFSQFTTMLSIIETHLQKLTIKTTKLTGQTRKRAEAIDEFQEGDAKVFLISLKAGGVGLNLTAADVVIHYDPWWNPAVERQATDRAHRIGQDKPVFVYKLITEETVEEKILAMQKKKQALADALYAKKGKVDTSFSQNDLMDLLKPLS